MEFFDCFSALQFQLYAEICVRGLRSEPIAATLSFKVDLPIIGVVVVDDDAAFDSSVIDRRRGLLSMGVGETLLEACAGAL